MFDVWNSLTVLWVPNGLIINATSLTSHSLMDQYDLGSQFILLVKLNTAGLQYTSNRDLLLIVWSLGSLLRVLCGSWLVNHSCDGDTCCPHKVQEAERANWCRQPPDEAKFHPHDLVFLPKGPTLPPHEGLYESVWNNGGASYHTPCENLLPLHKAFKVYLSG